MFKKFDVEQLDVGFLEKGYNFQIVETIVVIVILFLLRQLVGRLARGRMKKADFATARKKLIGKFLNFLIGLLFIIIVAGIWGIKRSQILAYLASVLTVVGVGLFAQWSLLSNITSGFILFFYHPLRIGDFVRIEDKDTFIEGQLEDMTMFFMYIRDKHHSVFTISNTDVIQKRITIIDPELFIFETVEEEKKKEALAEA